MRLVVGDRIARGLPPRVICRSVWWDVHASGAAEALTRAEQLGKGGYFARTQTTGAPQALVLTRVDWVDVCAFVDRNSAAALHFQFDASLFENGGTVIAGELQQVAPGRWVFLMTDLLRLRGVPCQQTSTLQQRLEQLYDLLATKVRRDPDMDACHFQVMRHYQVHSVEDVLREVVPGLPYGAAGIRLCPAAAGGRQRALFLHTGATKGPASLHAPAPCARGAPQPRRPFHKQLVAVAPSSQGAPVVRLMYVEMSPQPDVYRLYETARSSVAVGIAGVRTMEKSKYLRQLFAGHGARVLMRCTYDAAMAKWVPNERV
jgi:hypothetical protein